MTGPDVRVRRARAADAEAVARVATDTWPDREVTDYVADAFPRWVDAAGPDRRPLVAELEGSVVGLLHAVRLSDREAWAQGVRVAPDARGRGVGEALTDAAFEWAAGRGATVMRNLVFAWNDAGLGLASAAGFEPVTAFRWAHPAPDADASPALDVVADPDAAWSRWRGSPADRHLRGLALDPDEPWALRELTPRTLARAADREAVLALRDGSGTRAATFRTRTDDPGGEDGSERLAEYGVGVWTDAAACRALLAAVAADAAAVDADRTRVLVPETVRHAADVARCRTELADHADYVLAADLTARD